MVHNAEKAISKTPVFSTDVTILACNPKADDIRITHGITPITRNRIAHGTVGNELASISSVCTTIPWYTSHTLKMHTSTKNTTKAMVNNVFVCGLANTMLLNRNKKGILMTISK